MAKMRILGVTAVVCAIALAATQLGAQDTAAREARDRADIEALMWRYARALDTRKADAYAAAYTPDGQFVADGNATKGRAVPSAWPESSNGSCNAACRRQSKNSSGFWTPSM